jgi:hypothetical protein
MADDTIILCDPATLGGGKSRLSSRTNKSGAVRYHVTVESEPLIHVFDPKSIGAPVANAMMEVLKEKTRGIVAGVAVRTLAFRKEAAKAFSKGAPWALKRYSGGRTGAMAPNTSGRAFNDSGRFVESIALGASDDAWRINVAANRLDPRTAGGELGVRRMWNRLVQLVPEWGEPMRLFNDKRVQDGLKQSLDQLIVKAEKTKEALTAARAKARVQAVRQIIGTLLQLVA